MRAEKENYILNTRVDYSWIYSKNIDINSILSLKDNSTFSVISV